jgi:beta-glucanase (GH16 family)
MISTSFLVLSLLAAVSSQDWTLVWSDEFDGNALNTTNWKNEVDCWGGGNGELQCFTSRPNNIRVESGNLIITAIPGTYTGTADDCTNNFQNTCTATRDYTSGRIRSKPETGGTWLFGRWEIRAQLPLGKHLWPALWMLPTDNVYGKWAASGEIDIMEYRGQVPNSVEGTLHFGGSYPDNTYQGSGPTAFPTDFSRDYHVFACEWDESEIRWYVDDKLYHNMTLNRSFYSGRGINPYTKEKQPFDQRMYFIINLSIGGGFFPPTTYGTLTIAEAQQWANPTFKVDYVRVYQKPQETTNPKAADTNNRALVAGAAVLAVLLIVALAAIIVMAIVIVRLRKRKAPVVGSPGSSPTTPREAPISVPISTYDNYRTPDFNSGGTRVANPLQNRGY